MWIETDQRDFEGKPKRGWCFDKGYSIPGLVEAYDHNYNFNTVLELYERADAEYDGAITLPLLWDKWTHTIVNNESSEIVRMLNDEFNEFAKNKELNIFPKKHEKEIEELQKWIHTDISEGVYKAGFARSQ